MLINRFWRKVDKRGPDDCWLWIGTVDKDGYGKIGARSTRTHRFVYMLCVGVIGPGLCVCHSCDTPACCNPAHLWLGTNDDNMADKVAKGRHPKGARVVTAKLTAEQVAEIRRSTDAQQRIASRFGIGQTQVSRIKRGESWAHV